MAIFEIVLPRMGESITEATITKWLKKPGDPIAEEEAIAEIATDKVDSEIPSPVEGIVKELLFKEGDVVEVDKVLAIIETSADTGKQLSSENSAKSSDSKQLSKPVENIPDSDSKLKPEESTKFSKTGEKRFYSPLIRNIAREEGIQLEELDKVAGSGKDSRLTKDDLLKYLKDKKEGKLQNPVVRTDDLKIINPSSGKSKHTQVKINPGDEIIEMTRKRKLIVDHMVASKDTSVHVTSVIEIDVTNLVNWREKHKKSFEAREGVKLTFTPIFIWAIAKALKDYPMLNTSVDHDKIIIRKNINIGMATALPDGNLIVPVIKNADHKSLLGLAKSVNDLADRARTNKLLPDEIQDGTFTITNLGAFDTIFATPIINQPQVAILATGTIKKKPMIVETEQGDTIGICSMMYLSMSYDHRIIDGALGGLALKRMGEYLVNWDINQEI